MKKFSEFLKRKNIIFSAKRYGVDALGAMAQGLFCSLLIGTILNTIGTQFALPFFNTMGSYASAMSGPAMAIAIGYALKSPPLVLFALTAVGSAANGLGGAGGPLAVLIIAIIAAECGKAVSGETKVDLIVTPFVTILVGVALAALCAPAIGKAASALGNIIMWATELQPFLMGIVVSVVIGIALTLPISSAAICAALSLTGLAGGAAVDPGAFQKVSGEIVLESSNADQFIADHPGDPVQPSPVKGRSPQAGGAHIHTEVVFPHGGGYHILRNPPLPQVVY